MKEHTIAEKLLIHDLLDSVSLRALDGLPLKPPWPLFLQLNKGVLATIILMPKLRPFSWFGEFGDCSHAYEPSLNSAFLGPLCRSCYKVFLLSHVSVVSS